MDRRLPLDLVASILSWTGVRGRPHVARVCKLWHSACFQPPAVQWGLDLTQHSFAYPTPILRLMRAVDSLSVRAHPFDSTYDDHREAIVAQNDAIRSLSTLTQLSIAKLALYSGIGVAPWSHLPSLRTLVLQGGLCCVVPTDVPALPTTVKQLALEHMLFVTPSEYEIDRKIDLQRVVDWVSLAGRGLEELQLIYRRSNDPESVASSYILSVPPPWSTLSNLRSLMVDGCLSWTTASIQSLFQHCTQLQVFATVIHTQDLDWSACAPSAALRELSLSFHSDVSDNSMHSAVQWAGKCLALERITMYGVGLQTANRILDLAPWISLEHLQDVSLLGWAVGEHSAMTLARLPALRSLSLKECRVRFLAFPLLCLSRAPLTTLVLDKIVIVHPPLNISVPLHVSVQGIRTDMFAFLDRLPSLRDLRVRTEHPEALSAIAWPKGLRVEIAQG